MFDSSDRQACRVKPGKTSTPLHALTTLNDPTWIEASRFLAEKIMLEAHETSDRLETAYRHVTAQTPSVAKLSVLERAYDEQLAIFEQNPKEADKLLAIGEKKRNLKLPSLEHAALTQVCLGILNLDQSLTRE